MKPVAVLGAGLAGLTAADELQRRGLPFVVFEAGKAIGGMAASFKDEQGFSYDFGANFISNRLADAMGATAACRTVKHYGETVMVDGKVYNYPFGLMRAPRFAAGAIGARLQRREITNAADWFRQTCGEAMARDVAIPLIEAWSGASATDLAPSVGEKFRGGVLKSLYLRAAARVTGRAVCNGYARDKPESAQVFHVYPEGGVAKLLEPSLQRVKHAVRLESPVEKILVEQDRVSAVRVKGETIEVSSVVSTAPVNILPRLVAGTTALDHLSSFRYRPMIFVNLRFAGRHLLPDTMLWVPDRSMPFFRLTEAPISMPWLAPDNKTLITFDIGCEVGDEHWTRSEDELAAICLEGICRMYPGLRDRYLGNGGTVRTPVSYPVYRSSYEEQRQQFSRSTGVDGLYSIGRNGEFAHILMEDVYWRTLRRVDEIDAYVRREERRVSTERSARASAGTNIANQLAGLTRSNLSVPAAPSSR